MKLIAIPTRDGMVDDHFGHCAYYTVVTLDEQSMFLYLRPLQRNRASRSGPFICRASLRHKTPPRLSQHTHSSAMVSI